MELNCSQHQQFHAIYLKLDELPNSLLKCAKCITQLKQSGEQLVVLQEISDGDDSTIISNWPPLTDTDILNQVYEIVNKQSDSSVIKKLDVFFESIKLELNQQLSTIHQVVTAQIDTYQNSNKKLLQIYNTHADKTVLKQMLQSQNTTNSISEQFADFIKQKIKNKEIATKEIQQALDNYKESVQEIDLDIPLRIKQDILHSLEKICLFFEKETVKNKQSKIEIEQGNEEGCEQSSSCSNVDNIIKMIFNKSNYCNEQYMQKIKAIFHKYSVLFNKEEALSHPHIQHKSPIDFSHLTSTQLQHITLLANHYTLQNSQQQNLTNSNPNSSTNSNLNSYSTIPSTQQSTTTSTQQSHTGQGSQNSLSQVVHNKSNQNQQSNSSLTEQRNVSLTEQRNQSLAEQFKSIEDQQNKQSKDEQNKTNKSSSDIDMLMEMIQNRSNFLNIESVEKLKEAFDKVEPFFKGIVRSDRQPVTFHEIDESQFETIIKLAQNYRDQDYMSKPSQNISQVMKLISNSSNFIRTNFMIEIEEQLNKVKCLVDELQMGEDIHTSEPINFEYVSFDQLQDIKVLAKKYSELNLANSSKSARLAKSSHQEIYSSSSNTFIVQQYIDFKFFNESDTLKIKNLLTKYPIFETLDIANPYRDLTKEVNFVASLYNNSDKNVKIWRNHSRELVIEHFQCQNQSIQTVFDSTLDPNLKYLIRIEIEPMNNFNYYSRIGLIRSSFKNTHRVFADNLCFCNQNTYGLTHIVRGKSLNDPTLRFSIKTRSLEFRIWIKGKLFSVSDYPHYHHINTIQHDSKEIELYPSLTLATLGFNIKHFVIKYFKVLEHYPIQ